MPKIICIIDNDPIYRLITRKLIEKSNLFSEMTFYSNGEEGLHGLTHTENLPDIILLDIEMPVMDGWDFLDEFNQLKTSIHKDIKIYVVSSSILNEDKGKTSNYPWVSGFISKPLDLEKLNEIANSASL